MPPKRTKKTQDRLIKYSNNMYVNAQNRCYISPTVQGPRSKLLSGGGGGLNWTKFFFGGGCLGILFNFSEVTENAFI